MNKCIPARCHCPVTRRCFCLPAVHKLAPTPLPHEVGAHTAAAPHLHCFVFGMHGRSHVQVYRTDETDAYYTTLEAVYMTSTYMDMYTSMHATLAIQHGRGPACTSWRCVAPSVPSSEHCYIVIVTRVRGRGAMRSTHHTGRSPCTVQSPSCARRSASSRGSASCAQQRTTDTMSRSKQSIKHRHTQADCLANNK